MLAAANFGSALEETRRLRRSVETMNDRLSLLKERQDFTKRIIGPSPPATPVPTRAGGADQLGFAQPGKPVSVCGALHFSGRWSSNS